MLNFSQNIANKMNIIVYAPNNLLWAYPSGKYVIAQEIVQVKILINQEKENMSN